MKIPSMFCGVLWFSVLAPQLIAVERPNVILVMTDDQGYGDVGFHGNEMIQTPNLDALARESVRFTNFHVDPTCSETRAALMTGRYACRTGVWHTILGRSLLRRGEATLADAFQSNGYRTGIFGKWHLGDNFPFRALDRGFQQVLINGGGGVGQTPDYWENNYFDDTYFRNDTAEKQRGYCTDVWFDAAIDFMKTTSDRPFFCYIPTNAPHGPFHVAPHYSRPYVAQGVPQPMANFYGMIANFDENMGRLLEALERNGIADETILVFMTDNGTAAGARPRGKPQPGKWEGFNAGMRGQKGSQYEGGHRVPCFVRWPGRIGKARDINNLAAHMDLFPTLSELCQLPHQGKPWDGVSLVPLLQEGQELGPRTLVVHSQRVDRPEKWRKSSVMTDQWRLVDGEELYDIQKDPGQQNNVAVKHAGEVARLRSEYEDWWASVSTRFGEYCEIILGDARQNPTTLTCHDWHSDRVPWNQGHINQDLMSNGFWAVEITQAGTYRCTLRARPAGVAYALQEGMATLKIGDESWQEKIVTGVSEVSFEVELLAGKCQVTTTLQEIGRGTRGAYFLTVERMN